ncbi:hypothetical protein BX666DRAFT_1980924 [Dichotomocladium elegans]|nr:hypothetical protein BX666DRAFT_1980924 [Dichotomocladium elegans]
MNDNRYPCDRSYFFKDDLQPCAISPPEVCANLGIISSPTSISATSGAAAAAIEAIEAEAIGEIPVYHYHHHSMDYYEQGLDVFDDVDMHAPPPSPPSPHEWVAGPCPPFRTGSCKQTVTAEHHLYVCTKGCGKVFRRRADMIRHTKTTKAHSSLRLFECGLCGSKFTRKCDRSRHLKKTCVHRR